MAISFTETAAFRHLIDFAADVTQHADATGDEELQELVRDLHGRLLEAYCGE